MKIEGHGQAAILTQAEIELLFNEGLQSDRDRTLFGGVAQLWYAER
jgi:integrase/recombinase XerD